MSRKFWTTHLFIMDVIFAKTEPLCLFKVFVSPYFGIFYGESKNLTKDFLTPLGVINQIKNKLHTLSRKFPQSVSFPAFISC